MNKERGDPSRARGASGEQPSDAEGFHSSDAAPATSQQRKLVLGIRVGAGLAGVSAGLTWLPNTPVADVIKGVVLVIISVLILLGAVLFAPRSEPAKRLVEIIKAWRNRKSDP